MPADHFSKQAAWYRRFRPHYPEALYTFLRSQVPAQRFAWDCATGNGQVATALSSHFRQVDASDISEAQMELAPRLENVFYTICPAEHTPYPDQFFDLITVGTAVHWFHLNAFYAEVRRVAAPGALIAVWCYGLIRIQPEIDRLVHQFYSDTLKGCWEFNRHYVDEHYRTLPFPFDEIPTPELAIETEMTPETLGGFLQSWSSVQTYMERNGINPIPDFLKKLTHAWPQAEPRPARFPIYIRAGHIV